MKRIFENGGLRHILTGVASGVIVAVLVGAVGYFEVVIELRSEVEQNGDRITKLEKAQARSDDQYARERVQLLVAIESLRGDIRGLNDTLGDLKDRLQRQEERQYNYRPDGGYGGR